MTLLLLVGGPIEFPLKLNHAATRTVTMFGHRITTRLEIDPVAPQRSFVVAPQRSFVVAPQRNSFDWVGSPGLKSDAAIGTRLVCMVTP